MRELYSNFKITLSIFFFFINLTLASQPEGIQLTRTANGYAVDFTISQFGIESTVIEDEEFISLTIPDYGVSPEVGLPSLPLVSFNLFISYNEQQPTYRIKEMKSEEIKLRSKIFPFQMPWEKSNSLSDRPFTINRDYYNSAGKVNQPIIFISEPFIISGVKGVMVTIYPFNYNPVENMLTIINALSFEINLENPVMPTMGKSESSNNFFENVFVNYDGINDGLDSRYLIITAPEFEANMSTFVNHKNSSGFDVDMFSTNTTGTTAISIKNFIQQRYDNIGTRPEYLLLVGDVSSIPAWNGSGTGSPSTDLNYVQLDGNDYFPDVFIGGFSVSSPEELQNAIEKSTYMETYIGTLQ